MGDATAQDKIIEALNAVKHKSEDDYEKNLTYIAAGTLVLSVTFLEKVIKLEEAGHVGILVSSWGALTLTLLVNLVSHQLASLYCDRLSQMSSKDLNLCLNKIDSYNYRLRAMNWSSTICLILGIFLLVLFCSLHALKF